MYEFIHTSLYLWDSRSYSNVVVFWRYSTLIGSENRKREHIRPVRVCLKYKKIHIGYVLKSQDVRTQVSGRNSENSSHTHVHTRAYPHTPMYTSTNPSVQSYTHTLLRIPAHFHVYMDTPVHTQIYQRTPTNTCTYSTHTCWCP